MSTNFHYFLTVLFLFSLKIQTSAQGVLFLESTHIDLGDVPSNELIHFDIPLENIGSSTLQLKEVIGDCDCTSLELSEYKLENQEKTSLKVVLNTQGYEGYFYKYIYITTDEFPFEYQLKVSANAVQNSDRKHNVAWIAKENENVFLIEEKRFYLENLKPFQEHIQTIRLLNTSKKALQILSTEHENIRLIAPKDSLDSGEQIEVALYIKPNTTGFQKFYYPISVGGQEVIFRIEANVSEEASSN